MKISNKYKRVKYFGLFVFCNKNHKFLAIDEDGILSSYALKPTVHESHVHNGYWHPKNNDFEWCAEVDLEGLDWRETLVELK